MRDCRRRTLLVLVLLAALLVAGPSFAPSLADDSDGARREHLLRSKLTLVFLFERDMPAVAEKAQAVSRLEQEILEAQKTAPGLEDLLHELQLQWAKLLLSRDQVDEALLLLDKLLNAGPDAFGFNEAALTTAGIRRDQAEELLKTPGNDDAALDLYAMAEVLFRRGGDQASALEVGQKSADLEAKQGLLAFEQQDYDKAWEVLSSLAGRERSGFSGSLGEQKLDWMKENTGILTVRTLTVPPQVPGQPVGGLRIALKRVRNGADHTRPFAERFRWQIGEYDLQPLGADGKPVLSSRVNLTTAGGVAEIPSKLPDDMAYIQKGGNVSRGFFIDKTEVTVGEFRKQFPSKSFKFSQSNLPAHGVTFQEAQAYAQRVGKKLPSYAQWQRAAFGDGGRTFPWGTTDPKSVNRHCNIGNPKPMAVGTLEAGRTESTRLEDMAGNVWEWLDDEHAIGGGFMDRSLSSPYKPPGWDKVIDFLRDKRPSKRIFAAYTNPDVRKKYDQYHIRDDILGEVGFRCVLEF